MNYSPHQLAFFAHQLTRRAASSSMKAMAGALLDALISAPKVLQTANPRPNSLLKLYGLVSFVEEKVFGGLDSFRGPFGALKDVASFDALKRRIAPVGNLIDDLETQLKQSVSVVQIFSLEWTVL